MIDTKHIGAGSYPEPLEDDEKCFVFNCDCSCKAKITVYAKSVEEARELCNIKDCDEIEVDNVKVEDILNYEVED